MSGNPGLDARTQIAEFTESGDPWDGIEMPEDFNPNNNPFLEPIDFDFKEEETHEEGLKGARCVVEAIKGSKMYQQEEGFVQKYRDGDRIPTPAGFVENPKWSHSILLATQENALWGLLLHGVGDSLDLVEKIKDSSLYDGHAGFSEEVGKDFHANSLWGLLLHANSLDSERDALIQKMKSWDDSYRGSSSSSLWGLLLNAGGYKEDAKAVVEKVRGSPLYDKGYVAGSLDLDGSLSPREGIHSRNCALFGLLAYATDYEDIVKEIRTVLARSVRPSKMINQQIRRARIHTIQDEMSSLGSSTCSIFFRAVGYSGHARIINKAVDHYFTDSSTGLLIASTYHNLRPQNKENYPRDNVTRGIALLKDGYKLFTGEK